MRPVPTWKSTAAAPTPTRLGPSVRALATRSVAAGAADGEQLLTLVDGEGLGGVVGLRLACGCERGVQPPGGRQREE